MNSPWGVRVGRAVENGRVDRDAEIHTVTCRAEARCTALCDCPCHVGHVHEWPRGFCVWCRLIRCGRDERGHGICIRGAEHPGPHRFEDLWSRLE